MRRKLFGCLLAVSAVALFVPALADDMEGESPKITVHGELRARWEYLDNYTDFNGTSGSDDTFDMTTYRARVGVDADFGSRVDGRIEIQNVGVFGNTILPSFEDPALQNLNSFNFGNETSLYQATIDINEVFSPNFSLRIGRQEHTEGNELHMGDADFYNGLAFDGIRGMYDAEKWGLDAFWYTIQERNVLPLSTVPGPTTVGGINGGSDDLVFAGVTTEFDIMDDGQKIEPYILLFHDGNLTSKAAFWTLGALYHRPPAQDRAMDWSAEFALQTGDVGSGAGEQDVKGWVGEGWFGWSWGDTSRHRVHVGALILSDGDSTTEVESFIPLFPDGHAHNRLGDMDMFTNGGAGAATNGCSGGGFNGFHNVTNINAGYDWTNGAHHFGGALHQFQATEDFGGACDGDYGQEVDLKYDYALTPNLSLQAGVAMFMPGDEFVAPNDDSAMRGWAQARLRF